MAAAVKVERNTPQGVASLWRQRLARDLAGEAPVQLIVTEPVDGLLPSLSAPGRVLLEGILGDYPLANFAGGDAEVRGGVGYAAACGMHSGNVEVHGSAGDMLAAHCRGGSVLLRGSCGADCGAGMAEGDVCVVGDAGPRCGRGMAGGVIVVFGNAGPGLGEGMTGGTVYVRGFAEQVDPRVSETRMRESDRLRLSLILLRVNLDASPRDFRTYRLSSAAEPAA